jgi:hypothetical protein
MIKLIKGEWQNVEDKVWNWRRSSDRGLEKNYITRSFTAYHYDVEIKKDDMGEHVVRWTKREIHSQFHVWEPDLKRPLICSGIIKMDMVLPKLLCEDVGLLASL